MACFFADENFPQPVVEELRRLGHDVLTTQEANLREKSVSDEAILSYATAKGRSVLTLNRKHFIHLHHTQLNHSGIIVCTFDFDFAGQARRIHAAIESTSLLCGHLIRVNRPG